MGGRVNVTINESPDFLDAVFGAISKIQAKSVYVGYPQDQDIPRKDEDGIPQRITNAALAYIHNTGMPEQNIPARPFMVEGVESKIDAISSALDSVVTHALKGDGDTAESGLIAAGTAAQSGIQNKLVDGPFEPLAFSTLKARTRKAGGEIGADLAAAAQEELDSRDQGNDPGVDLARPLNATGQLRKAVTFVIRKD